MSDEKGETISPQAERKAATPVPPMPEYLEAENLAPAIAAGLSHEETKAKWKKENPGKCIHDWRWHATGAGMGWFCDKCDEQQMDEQNFVEIATEEGLCTLT